MFFFLMRMRRKLCLLVVVDNLSTVRSVSILMEMTKITIIIIPMIIIPIIISPMIILMYPS